MNKFFFNKYKGEIILLIVTLLWSATFVIVKGALKDISSMLFIGLRFLIAGIILLPFLLRRKHLFLNKKFLHPIILGTILFFGFSSQTIGLKHTEATKSAFLTGTAVVIIPFIQLLIEKRKPKTGSVIGVAVVLAGILLLSGGNSILTLVKDIIANFNLGDFLTLVGALFYAIYVVYLDILSNKYEFEFLLIIQMLVPALLAFPFAFIFDAISYEAIHIEFTSELILAVLYTAIFATVVTTGLQTKYQPLVTPTKAGIVYSFEPIFAAIVAFAFLNERITLFGILGAGLIFVGLIISETFDNLIVRLKRS